MDYTFLIVVILVYLFYIRRDVVEFFNNNTVKVCSKVNGGCYHVQTRYNPNTYTSAADTLDTIHGKNMKFFKFLKNKYLNARYPSNLSVIGLRNLKKKKKMVKNLISRYDPRTIVEHVPKSDRNTSYVYAKGEKIGYCLRERKSGNNNIHPMETLYFVNLHELSHLADSDYNAGHNRKFWADFKFILKEAVEAGVYNPVDYSISPINYCGISIYYNPFYDNSLA